MDTVESVNPVFFQRRATTEAGHSNPIGHISVVGAGGIGARVIAVLSKLLPRDSAIKLYDPDIVEERNVIRQHFHPRDVGQPKALVVARRYTNDRVNIEPQVVRVGQATGLGRFVVLCVDNRATRKLIRDNQGYPPQLIIDGGNEDTYGQVILYGRIPDGFSVRGDLAFPELFDETLDDPEEGGCGVRVDTQTIMANQMVASLMCNYIHAWVYGKKIYTLGHRFSMSNTSPIRMRPHTVSRERYLNTYSYVPVQWQEPQPVEEKRDENEIIDRLHDVSFDMGGTVATSGPRTNR